MRTKRRLLRVLSIAIVSCSLHQEAISNGKAELCTGSPYGMTPAALAFWEEGVLDAAKATASIQEICRMKFRQVSRKPLHRLGISDETIDRASPLSLLYQRIGAERFAAQIAGGRSRSESAPPESARRTIRPEDMRISEQKFQQAVYNLRFNGNLGSDLQMLGRLGVRFQDQQGRARDFGEVLFDTAAALQRAVANGQMNRQEAEFAAREAGFHGSVATAVAVSDRDLVSAFKEAHATR